MTEFVRSTDAVSALDQARPERPVVDKRSSVAVRVAVHKPSPDGFSGPELDSVPDLGSADSTQADCEDVVHQATDLGP